MMLQMRLLQCGNQNRASQALTEATVAAVQGSIADIQRAAIGWFAEKYQHEYDGEEVPTEDHTPLHKSHRAQMKAVLGNVALKYETVYLCPNEHCEGFRRTKEHSVPCGTCGKSYIYKDDHGHPGVCTLRYFPFATLIRLLFADPLKARHLADTFLNCEPEPDAMSSVYGE